MSKDSHSGLELSHHSDRNVQSEQQLRQELIQRATTRLRKRVLEQGLQDVMRQMASLQAQLDTLRLEAVTTIDTMSDISEDPKTAEGTQRMNRQMDILEKRLESHKLGLFQLQNSHKFTSEAMTKMNSVESNRTSVSSLSLMSSLFGYSQNTSVSQATSISDYFPSKELDHLVDDDNISEINSCQLDDNGDDDDPFYDLAGKRSFKAGSFCGSVYHDNEQAPITHLPTQGCNSAEIRTRRRQRRQRHRQSMERCQQRMADDSDSVVSEDLSSVSSFSNYHSKESLCHPLSSASQISFFQPHCTTNFFDNSMQSWLSDHHPLQPKDSAWMYDSPQRNVLDEAMSFLDGLDKDDDDGGFEEDIYLLLQNPDLCSYPLSEIEATMKELRLQEKRGSAINLAIQLLKPSAWYQLGKKYSSNLVYQATCSGLQWCRFLSVLSAAVVISIMNGPEDIQSNSTY